MPRAAVIDRQRRERLHSLAMKQPRPRAKSVQRAPKPAPKLGTLASVQEAYFGAGAAEARAMLRQGLSEESLRQYHVISPSGGRPSIRTDTAPQDGITYRNFGAPAHWEAPYSVLQATFPNRTQTAYLHHSGEELLLPVDGSVDYHFYWSPGGERPKRRVLDGPVAVGDLVRIHPQVPHHTWAATRNGATAWMVFRDISGTSAAISTDTPRPGGDQMRASRRITEKELKDSGRPAFYAFITWGLAERLRFYRERAHLRVADVAFQCGIDASHLSRIENGDVNVSLDVLDRVTAFLHLDLEHLIDEHPWFYLRSSLLARSQAPADDGEWLLCPEGGGPHYLHARHWSAPANRQELPALAGTATLFTSWILLQGRLILRTDGSTSAHHELLEAGSVVHFRGRVPRWIQVLEDASCLEVVYTQRCPAQAREHQPDERRRRDR